MGHSIYSSFSSSCRPICLFVNQNVSDQNPDVGGGSVKIHLQASISPAGHDLLSGLNKRVHTMRGLQESNPTFYHSRICFPLLFAFRQSHGSLTSLDACQESH